MILLKLINSSENLTSGFLGANYLLTRHLDGKTKSLPYLDFVFVVNLLIHNLILYSVFKVHVVDLGGLEPPASRLSGVRSNLLSYRSKANQQNS